MALYLGGSTLGMRQHQHAGHAFDSLQRERLLLLEFLRGHGGGGGCSPGHLQRERLLLLEFLAPPFAAGQQLRVPGLGHREPSVGTLPTLLHVAGSPSGLLVRALQKLVSENST